LYFPMLLFWYYITIKYFWAQINKMKDLEMIDSVSKEVDP